MSFLRRLGFYMVGMGIGMMLVLFFFGPERTYQFFLGWLPKAEIKKEVALRSLTPLEDSILLNKLHCFEISPAEIHHALQDGSVDLSKSKTREIPKSYLFRIEHQEVPLAVMMQYQDSVHIRIVSIEEVVAEGSQPTKNCN